MTVKRVLFYFVLLVLLVVITFVLQNLSVVPLKFLFWSFEMRRAWLVFSLYSAGLVTGLIIAWISHLRGSEHRQTT